MYAFREKSWVGRRLGRDRPQTIGETRLVVLRRFAKLRNTVGV
jgi:hypothetical protein